MTFKLGEDKEKEEEMEKLRKDVGKRIDRELEILKEDRKICKEYLEEWRKKEKEWELRINRIEERIEEIERHMKERLDRLYFIFCNIL